MTPEQQELLAACEKDFSSRYTDSDPDYAKVAEETRSREPVILCPWYSQPRRNYDWARGRQRRDYRDNRNDRRDNRNDQRSGRQDNRDYRNDHRDNRHGYRDNRHQQRFNPYQRQQ